MLLPTACPVCEARGPAPCPLCRSAVRPAPELPPPPGLDSCLAVMDYEGVGREIVARLKYRNARSVVPWLAGQMAALAGGLNRSRVHSQRIPRAMYSGTSEVVVTWVPTTGARRRERGFDQARLLASAVARRLGLACRPLLRRRRGPAQTGRSRADRLAGPEYSLAPGPAPARILLVDDVVTTGATLAAAARVLRSAGAAEVHAVVAARRA